MARKDIRLVYRFRSLNERAIDIIENDRLYCASFAEMNDPMDGWFSHFKDNPRLSNIRSGKKEYKICALSTTYQSYLLWTHYANGFKGIAIEIEIDKKDIHKIDYTVKLPDLENLEKIYTDDDELVRAILNTKHKVFDYEKEVRILHKSKNEAKIPNECEYCKLKENAIKRILFFKNKVEPTKDCYDKLIETLKRKNIEVCNIDIDFRSKNIITYKASDINSLSSCCEDNMRKRLEGCKQ
jgi:hypothetical protein